MRPESDQPVNGRLSPNSSSERDVKCRVSHFVQSTRPARDDDISPPLLLPLSEDAVPSAVSRARPRNTRGSSFGSIKSSTDAEAGRFNAVTMSAHSDGRGSSSV